MLACHAGGPGSIPGRCKFCFMWIQEFGRDTNWIQEFGRDANNQEIYAAAFRLCRLFFDLILQGLDVGAHGAMVPLWIITDN